jgi:hypothetical protein
MKALIIAATIGLLLYAGWSIIVMLPWWGTLLLILGVALFGGLIAAILGALGSAAGLFLLAIFFLADGSAKKKRAQKYEKAEAERANSKKVGY